MKKLLVTLLVIALSITTYGHPTKRRVRKISENLIGAWHIENMQKLVLRKIGRYKKDNGNPEAYMRMYIGSDITFNENNTATFTSPDGKTFNAVWEIEEDQHYSIHAGPTGSHASGPKYVLVVEFDAGGSRYDIRGEYQEFMFNKDAFHCTDQKYTITFKKEVEE